MARQQILRRKFALVFFVLGIAVIFYYQVYGKNPKTKATKHSLFPIYNKLKVYQEINYAKYASFMKENSIIQFFDSLSEQMPKKVVTFEVPFNTTVNDLAEVTIEKYGDRIQILKDADVRKIDVDCVDLKTRIGKTQICVYKRKDDLFVSGSIRNNGHWEGNNLESLGRVLKNKPDMVFIDMGCNIGTFTTYITLYGNPTICIDPLMANLELVMKTLRLTNDEKNVILLWNAVSDTHSKVVLSQQQKHNIGSTRVRNLNESFKSKAANYEIPTILLDDLQDILANRRIFIKMDIESYEWRALAGGENFFKKTNVCYVMLEIVSHKMRDTGVKICNFLAKFGLYPAKDVDMKHPLNVTRKWDWPTEAIFVKNTTECKPYQEDLRKS